MGEIPGLPYGAWDTFLDLEIYHVYLSPRSSIRVRDVLFQ